MGLRRNESMTIDPRSPSMAVSFWHSKVLGILPFPGRRPPWQFPCPSPALVGRPPDQVRRAMWPAVTAEGDRRAPGQALDRQQHTNNGYTGRHTDTFSNLEGQGPRAPRLFAHANHILRVRAAGSPGFPSSSHQAMRQVGEFPGLVGASQASHVQTNATPDGGSPERARHKLDRSHVSHASRRARSTPPGFSSRTGSW